MERHSLDGVRAKLSRAKEHLDVLDEEWEKFLRQEPCPYRFLIDEHPIGRYNKISVYMREPVPLRLSTILGDAFHNLRSALDLLAHELVRAGGSAPSRTTAFPIYDSEREFLSRVEFRRRSDDRPGPLHGIEPGSEIWAFVKEMQPYQGGDCAKQLSTLRQLSNADKHRTLLVTGAFPEPHDLAGLIHWKPEARLVRHEFLLRPGEPLMHGAEVAHLEFDYPNGPYPDVQVEGQLSLAIAFSDGAWQAERPEALDLYTCLAEYVEQASAFFR